MTAIRASRASVTTSASIVARRSTSRSTPTPVTIALTSIAWATTQVQGHAWSTRLRRRLPCHSASPRGSVSRQPGCMIAATGRYRRRGRRPLLRHPGSTSRDSYARTTKAMIVPGAPTTHARNRPRARSRPRMPMARSVTASCVTHCVNRGPVTFSLSCAATRATRTCCFKPRTLPGRPTTVMAGIALTAALTRIIRASTAGRRVLTKSAITGRSRRAITAR